MCNDLCTGSFSPPSNVPEFYSYPSSPDSSNSSNSSLEEQEQLIEEQLNTIELNVDCNIKYDQLNEFVIDYNSQDINIPLDPTEELSDPRIPTLKTKKLKMDFSILKIQKTIVNDRLKTD